MGEADGVHDHRSASHRLHASEHHGYPPGVANPAPALEIIYPDSGGSSVSPTALTVDTDYTISYADHLMKITFTSDGLGKLQTAAATAGAQVQVDFTVAVADSAAGTIENDAKYYPSADDIATFGGEGDRGLETVDSADTQWGQIEFTKSFAKAPADAELQATFRLYDNYTDAKAGSGNWIRTDTIKNDATTGELLITGLRASDHIDGESAQPAGAVLIEDCVPTPGYIIYWLTEVEAPTGYELLAKPVPVVLTVGTSGETVTSTLTELKIGADGLPIWATDADGKTDGTACSYQLGSALTDITNVEANAGFQLPLTGRWDTLWLMVGSAALVGFVLLVVRRRAAEEA